MGPSDRDRAEHIKQTIVDARRALARKDYEQAYADRTAWLPFERCIEIISEASRKIPDAWKVAYGSEVPWRDVASIGNTLRHAYHHVVGPRLWSVYTDDLDPLEAAIDRMLAANPPPPSRS